MAKKRGRRVGTAGRFQIKGKLTLKTAWPIIHAVARQHGIHKPSRAQVQYIATRLYLMAPAHVREKLGVLKFLGGFSRTYAIQKMKKQLAKLSGAARGGKSKRGKKKGNKRKPKTKRGRKAARRGGKKRGRKGRRR